MGSRIVNLDSFMKQMDTCKSCHEGEHILHVNNTLFKLQNICSNTDGIIITTTKVSSIFKPKNSGSECERDYNTEILNMSKRKSPSNLVFSTFVTECSVLNTVRHTLSNIFTK